MMHFFNMIKSLRLEESAMLQERVSSIPEEEKRVVASFLEDEFNRETTAYPEEYPCYDPQAAMWAAQLTYMVAQLILFREHDREELTALIPPYPAIVTPEAVLSADLCLRFIPDMLLQLHTVDSADEVIELTKSHLYAWPYSALPRESPDIAYTDFSVICGHPVLYHMFCERIIQHKIITLAEHPSFYPGVSSQLGLHQPILWKEFKTLYNHHE